MSEPFFLCGAVRAGLLLVESMLAAHPDLAWGGDFDHAVEWPASEHAEWPPLVPYWQRLAFSKRARELGLTIDPALAFPDLVRSLLAQQRRGASRPFGVAVHGHYDHIVRLWPDARFIYLARSPGRAREAAGETEDEARLRQSDLAWRTIAATVAPSRRIELRYATLLTHLPTELARVCGFLGVSFDPALLHVPMLAPSGASPVPPADAEHSRVWRFAEGLGVRLRQFSRG